MSALPAWILWSEAFAWPGVEPDETHVLRCISLSSVALDDRRASRPSLRQMASLPARDRYCVSIQLLFLVVAAGACVQHQRISSSEPPHSRTTTANAPAASRVRCDWRYENAAPTS